jgi:[ribosomal protein S18]-alanine N-acetyltransferase
MSTLRPAQKSDFTPLFHFLGSQTHAHRHLDWRDPLEFLGRPPFWIQEDNQHITAALCCTPEPEEVAWIRLFAVSAHNSVDRSWQQLFAACLEDLRQDPHHPQIVSLSLKDWYEELLTRNGFHHHQDIVVFLFDHEPPAFPQIAPSFHLREMRTGDLEAVRVVDNTAFEPIWRLSLEDLKFAIRKSSYCSVIERDGQIVAYQVCSSNGMYAHLARLAVLPELQGNKLGFALVQNLLDYFINQLNYWGVTLNTQSDNTSSMALYHKIGFQETGERFPVFIYG